MSRRGQSEEQQTRRRITEAGQRPAPVLLVCERGTALIGDPLLALDLSAGRVGRQRRVGRWWLVYPPRGISLKQVGFRCASKTGYRCGTIYVII